MPQSPDRSDFTTAPLAASLRRLVLPMFLGMVMIAMVGVVDAYFIGKLGTDALAAFGLCYPAVMVLQAIMFGLATGITASLSRARGRRAGEPFGPHERLRVGVSMRLAVVLATGLAGLGALCGPALFRLAAAPPVAALALEYYRPYLLSLVCLSIPMSITACMRGFGETRSSATVMTLSSVLNAGLDPVLMFGWGPIPAFGMAGASMSTVVAYLVGASYAALLLRRALREAARGPAEGLAARTVVKEIAEVGAPAMLAQALGPVAGAAITGLTSRFGVAALAGLGILQRIDMLVMIVTVATGAGLMPLIGQSAGAGDMARAREALRLVRRSMVIWGLGVGMLLNLLGAPLAALFTADPDVAGVFRLALCFAPIGYVGGGLNVVTMSAFSAVGHPMLATKLSAVFTLLLLPTLGLLGATFFGLPGMFAGIFGASGISAFIGTRWMRLANLA